MGTQIRCESIGKDPSADQRCTGEYEGLFRVSRRVQGRPRDRGQRKFIGGLLAGFWVLCWATSGQLGLPGSEAVVLEERESRDRRGGARQHPLLFWGRPPRPPGKPFWWLLHNQHCWQGWKAVSCLQNRWVLSDSTHPVASQASVTVTQAAMPGSPGPSSIPCPQYVSSSLP